MSVDPAVIHASARAGDTRYPFSSWHPLPENATQPGITPTQLILHTEASGGKASNQASWNYWARTDIVAEAHFLLDMDGDMWQCMATNRRADNNSQATRAISIETQDLGGATVDSTPWTEDQLEQLAGLAAWCHLRWSIPLAPCPAWDQPGTSPHNAYPSQWSRSAHSCPGRARTAQMPEVLRRAQVIVDWTPPTHLEDTQTPTPPIVPKPNQELIMYTILTAVGKVPALTAIDGSGITQIGLTAEDVPKFSKAYNAPVIDIDPNVWQDINNKSKSDISPGA